jgi:hypothetical protein
MVSNLMNMIPAVVLGDLNNESTESYEKEAEIELMNISDSDASESMNMDDRIIPVDYFDALISHEKC